jgi:hypothetical protein
LCTDYMSFLPCDCFHVPLPELQMYSTRVPLQG